MTITDRIDAITGIPPEYRATIVPPPRSVKIELTGRCNFACAFCARGKNLREQSDMDKALYKRLAVEMRDAGVEELGLFYLGESMMLSWIAEAIMFAKDSARFPYVFLTTNGSLAKPHRLAACFRAGLDSLKFSCNYADARQFAEITRSDPRLFDVMMSNIMAARGVRDTVEKETGHRCGLYASFIEYDNDQKYKMNNLVKHLEPYMDEVYALPLYSQAEYVGNDERGRGWKVTAGNRGRVGALRDPIPCWSVFTESHITWDGKMSACCFDHDGSFEMGDLNFQTFMSCWNSEKFQELRKAHLAGEVHGTPCEKCLAYA